MPQTTRTLAFAVYLERETQEGQKGGGRRKDLSPLRYFSYL